MKLTPKSGLTPAHALENLLHPGMVIECRVEREWVKVRIIRECDCDDRLAGKPIRNGMRNKWWAIRDGEDSPQLFCFNPWFDPDDIRIPHDTNA